MTIYQPMITEVNEAAFAAMSRSLVHGAKTAEGYTILIFGVTAESASAFVQSTLRGPVPSSIKCLGVTAQQKQDPLPSQFILLLPELKHAAHLRFIGRHIRAMAFRHVGTRVVASPDVAHKMFNEIRDYWASSRSSFKPLSELKSEGQRVFRFTSDLVSRYTYPYGHQRHFPVIEADCVMFDESMGKFNGHVLSNVAWLINHYCDLDVFVDSHMIDTMFKDTAWLQQDIEADGDEKARDESREILRLPDADGFFLFTAAGKPIPMPFYENGELCFPPFKRPKVRK